VLTLRNGLARAALDGRVMSGSRLRDVEGCPSWERRSLAKGGMHEGVGTSNGDDIMGRWRRLDTHGNERGGT